MEGFGEWRGVVALGLPKKLNLVILIVENLKILGMDVMRRKIFDMSFSSVYPHYLVKVQKKGKTQDELGDFQETTRRQSGDFQRICRRRSVDFRDFRATFRRLSEDFRTLSRNLQETFRKL